MKTLFIIILLFSGISLFSQDVSSKKEKLSQKEEIVDPVEVFKDQRISQGEIVYSQAVDYFKERMYKSCIEKSLDFLVLYPKHNLQLPVLKLLSEAYYKDEQLDRSIRTDIKIYKEYPTTEDGLESYLEAARKLLKTGRRKDAKSVLEEIKGQMYSYKVAKEAEIELNQLKILYPEPEPQIDPTKETSKDGEAEKQDINPKN
ncbi:MAG: hypothetical protein KDK36_18490 [Leptospiraceae bacterium]|nr:hypothetical protein [Leptospiraceae bacterium]